MRIYLDSRDLIALIEKRSSEDIDRFEERLRKNGSVLVFSMHNIMECCAPLVRGGGNSSVMKTLNRLEQLPHIYIAEARIEGLELQEAASAFIEQREYLPCTLPVVPRFDYAVCAFEKPPTKQYIQYGLAQTVFELWLEDKSLFAGYSPQVEHLRAILESDRKRPEYRRHERNFQYTVGRNLRLFNIGFPQGGVGKLSAWIYENPARCPAHRLGYEVFHKLLRNLTDSGESSDIPDFAHISCVPYVDMITLDNRMRGYVAQVDQSIGANFSHHVFANVSQIEASL